MVYSGNDHENSGDEANNNDIMQSNKQSVRNYYALNMSDKR